MTKRPALTLKKVAEIIGVSNATVSNAFNRPDQLSKKKREEILKACIELGYHGPNQAARSLRKGTSDIVALILPDSLNYMVSDPVASQFMQGVTDILEKNNINILLFSGRSPSINKIVDFVDGFICYGAPRNSELVAQLEKTTKKVVTIDFNIANRASINIDNEQAAAEITNHITQSDDNIFAVLGLRLIPSEQVCRVYDNELLDSQSSISHRRLDGYTKALTEQGIELTNELIWNVPESNIKLAAIAAREALTTEPRPNVLLCMSDMIALSTLREAQALGLRVPEDVKIVGFDGIDESQRSTPTLTTVHQNSVLKGQRAAQLFLDGSIVDEVLAYTVQQGNSC